MNVNEFPGFDKKTFCERMMNDDELIIEILELFLSDTPNKIQALKAAFNENNAKKVQDLAHSIKGTTANVCMHEMMNLAYKIEIAGKDNLLKDIESDILQLEEKFKFAQSQLA